MTRAAPRGLIGPMAITFTTTFYDEDTDMTYMYREGSPYVVREQCSRTPEETLLVVLGDMADCAADANLACAAQLRAQYDEAAAEYDAMLDDRMDAATFSEHWSDTTWYPPDGVQVDWDGDAGTVTVTVAEGWKGALAVDPDTLEPTGAAPLDG